MKAVKETIRKYYKYIVTEWTQPVISSNGTMGSSSFACYPKGGGSGYAAFDGNTSSYWYHYGQSDHLKWISFYSADPIKISSLHLIFDNVNRTDLFYSHPSTYLFANVNNGNGWNTNAAGYNSGSPNSNWVRLGSVGSTGSAEYDLACTENEDYYNYFQLIVNLANYVDNHDGIALKECQITADYIDSVETTPEDYDFYKDTYEYSLPSELVEREYYKYNAWEQPILTSNGTLGGDSFACWANNVYGNRYAYYALDGNTTQTNYENEWTSSNSSDYIIYNPIPIKITNIEVYNRNENTGNGTQNVRAIRSGTVYGSNDNNSWEELITFSNNNFNKGIDNGIWNIDLSNNQNTYNYYKLSLIGDGGYVGVGEFNITAQTISKSDSSDYDFFKDKNKYYAIKSYEKGQYYGN